MQCFHPCDECIHNRKVLKDGWMPCCDAFPDGIPDEIWNKDVTKLKECNDGFRYIKQTN